VPRHLGEVEVLSGPVSCADGQCYNLRVTCPEVAAAAEARLKVGMPTTASPRGTILFATGNQGVGLYENRPESRRTLAELAAAGFRTVQVDWIEKKVTPAWRAGRRPSPAGSMTICTNHRHLPRFVRPGSPAVHRRSATC
jgi:hypothetical protein